MMTLPQFLLIGLSLFFFKYAPLATTGYLVLPRLFYCDEDIFGLLHEQYMKKWDTYLLNRRVYPLLCTALSFAFYPYWNWKHWDPENILFYYLVFVCLVVMWKAATLDIDLAAGKGYLLDRVLLIASFAGFYFYPGFLFLFLFVAINSLRAWYHSQQIPIRILQVFLATLTAYGILKIIIPSLTPLEPMFFMILLVLASHYFVSGAAKLKGPKWHTWMTQNRIHFFFISRYMWGWLRFLPERSAIALANSLQPLNLPFQWGTVLFELGAILILFHDFFCIVFLIAALFFHVSIALLGGIFFWQCLLIHSALLGVVLSLSQQITSSLFGAVNGLLFASLMVLFPLRKKIWAPNYLAWWDTPFIQKIYWTVRGESGKEYGLYNDFMCPNERIFGLKYGFFLSKEKRITDHAGLTFSYDIAKNLYQAGENVDAVRELKERYGVSRFDSHLFDVHAKYMSAFFNHYNSGKRKAVVPSWLKASGGLWYYWGSLPPFKGQEKINRVAVRYREEYFTGKKIVTLKDEALGHILFKEES